jgi:hypothetical protein
VKQSLLPTCQRERLEAANVAAGLAASLGANGKWPDIDYSNKAKAHWPLLFHLTRVTNIATGWACEGCDGTSGAPALLSATILALRVWLQADFTNPNWYQNQIAVPRAVGNIAVLLRNQSDLSAADAARITTILGRAKWEHETGSNKLDMLRIQLLHGVFGQDVVMVEQAFNLSFAGVRYFNQSEDSFQVDHSFHQHGAQLLAGEYGAVCASNVLALAAFAAGTTSAMDDAALVVFERYVLDGLAWYTTRSPVAGAVWDWQVHGRGVTVPFLGSEWKWVPAFGCPGCPSGCQGCFSLPGIAVGLDSSQLRQVGSLSPTGREGEWEAFADLVNISNAPNTRSALQHGTAQQSATLSAVAEATHAAAADGARRSLRATAAVGNRQYYDSDYVVHSRASYLFSVHMFSDRTVGAATINGEGLLDRHLADGATSLQVDGGGAYLGPAVFPCWDWSRPPGTTVAPDGPPPGQQVKHATSATFVGSASDGVYGVAAQRLAPPPTAGGRGQPVAAPARVRTGADCNADKSWLMFDSVIVCRGVANQSSPNTAVVTSIEQSNLQGLVSYAVGSGPVTTIGIGVRMSFDLGTAAVWLWHAQVGYLVARTAGATLHLSTAVKNGSWWDIAPGDAGSGQVPLPDNGTVSLPVFDCYIDHTGAGPGKTDGEQATVYEYMVLPGVISAGAMPGLAARTGGVSVSGTSTYHAAADLSTGRLLGVLWANAIAVADPATVVVVGGWTVAPSRPCLFVLQGLANGTVVGHASVPDVGSGTLTIAVTTAPRWQQHTWPLNGNAAMGRDAASSGCTLFFDLPGESRMGQSTRATCE